jgi:hypothetical protein
MSSSVRETDTTIRCKFCATGCRLPRLLSQRSGHEHHMAGYAGGGRGDPSRAARPISASPPACTIWQLAGSSPTIAGVWRPKIALDLALFQHGGVGERSAHGFALVKHVLPRYGVRVPLIRLVAVPVRRSGGMRRARWRLSALRRRPSASENRKIFSRRFRRRSISFVSHSQITSTRQPALLNSSSAQASRSTFRFSLARQNSRLLCGIEARLQWGCWCQKQP